MTDCLVLASICGCDHVAISVFEPGVADPTYNEPHSDLEVVLTGPDWRPLVVQAATELHQRYPDCRISPMCTSTYAADRSRDAGFALDELVTNAMYAAFPRHAEEQGADNLEHDQAMQRLLAALTGTTTDVETP